MYSKYLNLLSGFLVKSTIVFFCIDTETVVLLEENLFTVDVMFSIKLCVVRFHHAQ